MTSFSIQNFGCRVNQAEAFDWAEALERGGLTLLADPARSDLVLVNSCTLTQRADRDVKKFIRRSCRENPAARLVITGCWAEAARDEVVNLPQVLLILANAEKERLPERVLALLGRPAPGNGGFRESAAEAGAAFRSRAFLKIQDGCDNGCTFCIIPSVRGRSVSLAPGEVRDRIRRLADRGYREIVLAGIHLSSYGTDLGPDVSLLGLLRNIEGIEGLGRVRLSSLDPRRMDAALMAYIAGHPKICQHFHLSLQHASDRVLREMGRAVPPGTYESILAELRERSPQASLGADVLVGFPGETEADFAVLETFLRQSPLTYFHVFPYSPRAGTPAAARAQVPERLKRERALVLRQLSAEKNFRFRSSFSGQDADAVVIRRAGDRAELLTGNYFKVCVPWCPAPERGLVRVRLGRVLASGLEGAVA
jgi:threonylcarbamoyladenosine tRNA methylthiotransferase MtaB